MSFELIRQMMANRSATPSSKGRDYPLSALTNFDLQYLALGSVVRLAPAEASIQDAINKGSALTVPKYDGLVVQAYGSRKDDDWLVHRFYLGDHLMQVYQGPLGEKPVVELLSLLYQEPNEENGSVDWDFWLFGQDPMIKKPEIRWDATGALYKRAWGSATAQTVEPLDYREVVKTDNSNRVLTAQAMKFYRMLDNDFEEALYINALGSQDEKWLEAHVGFLIDPMEIEVI